jgi:hypothetical protein
MKNNKTCSTLFTTLFSRPMLLIMVVASIVTSACHSEEKKQSANMQAVDTLNKETFQQEVSETPIVFPGGDNIQQDCQFLQGEAEVLLEEYYRKETHSKRLEQIIVELKNLEQEWKQMDCQQVFGFIVPQIPTLPHADKKKQPVLNSRN